MESNAISQEIAVADIKLREINCELNPLVRSDGSVLFAQGGTCVLASTHGPIDVKPQNLKIDEAYIECVYRPKAGVPTIKDKLLESIIKEICEAALLTTLHPRTMISVQIQELNDRFGLEACSINAACMAMLIAGVPMKFSIAAVNCIIDKQGQIVLDPDHFAAKDFKTSFLFVFDSVQHDLVSFHSRGRYKVVDWNRAELLCRTASKLIFKVYREVFEKLHNKFLLTASPCKNSEAMKQVLMEA